MKICLDSYLSEVSAGPPEGKLWAAVTARALLDATHPRSSDQKLAKAWIFSNSEETYSFSWCAEILSNANASGLVSAVREHVDRGIAPNRKQKLNLGDDVKKVFDWKV